MASRADAQVRVEIVGDADKLAGELKEADKGLSKFTGNAKAMGAAIAGAGIVAAGFEFGQDALNEAERLDDATRRLQGTLGEMSANELAATADQFTSLGASTQDILELEGIFADTATALGVGKEDIAAWADDAAAIAVATGQIKNLDPTEVIEGMGEAADGSVEDMKKLGIFIDEAAVAQQALLDTGKTSADQLTDSELKAARYKLVMEALRPNIDLVTQSSEDLGLKQDVVGAKFETLMGKIGAGVEGPLNDLLDGILTGIEGFEGLTTGTHEWNQGLQDMFTPLARFNDLLEDASDLANQGAQAIGRFFGIDVPSNQRGTRVRPTQSPDRGRVTINVQPNAHDDTERAVVNALRDHNRRNGIL